MIESAKITVTLGALDVAVLQRLRSEIGLRSLSAALLALVLREGQRQTAVDARRRAKETEAK